MTKQFTIGIDLGTTFSCVAVSRNDAVEVIANEHGQRVTPSCVAFEEGQRSVGLEARNNIYLRPANTVFGIKRIIGRRFQEPEVQHYRSKWPFRVVATPDELPAVEISDTVHVNNESRTVVSRYSPVDISAFVLEKMKAIAEDYLGNGTDTVILHAVITVPANFNDSQRRATKAAGEQAGLKVLAVVNEPTAAAVAYGLDLVNRCQTILVFDLGGGTLDVSILRIENGQTFNVLSTCGNPALGGEDFDERLLEYCVSRFEEKHNVAIDRKSASVSRLRLKVEEAKKGLINDQSRTVVALDVFDGGHHLQETISKAKFDALCEELFAATLQPVEEALRRAELDKGEIDQVVLVGGCSRIPRIREQLTAYFSDQRINRDINADEAIAYGAAVLARQLLNDTSSANTNSTGIQFSDVTPFSLGTEVAGGYMAVLIPQNTRIPARETRDFTTERDNVWWVNIPIYEGESSRATENRLLGKFRFSNFQRGRAGEPQIGVTFEYDRSGIVNVTAVDQRTGNSADVQINRAGMAEERSDSDSDEYPGNYDGGELTDDDQDPDNRNNDRPDEDDALSDGFFRGFFRFLAGCLEDAFTFPSTSTTLPAPVTDFIRRYVEPGADRPELRLASMDDAFPALLHHFHQAGTPALSAILKIKYQEGIDRGGVSRDVTQAAWEQARDYRHAGVRVFEGEPFKTVTSQPIEDWVLRSIGKFLFASIVHGYAWPTWLDSSMFYYMVDAAVDTENAALVNATVADLLVAVDQSTAPGNFPAAIPQLFAWMEHHDLQACMWRDKNKSDLKSEIVKYELYTRRRGNILLIREGLNQNNFLEVIKNPRVVHGLMESLCRVVTAADDLLRELSVPEHSTEHREKEETSIKHLAKYIKTASVDERRALMIFITGYTRIPLPKKIQIMFHEPEEPFLPTAQTCGPYLRLGIHYLSGARGYAIFKRDLQTSITESRHQFQNS